MTNKGESFITLQRVRRRQKQMANQYCQWWGTSERGDAGVTLKGNLGKAGCQSNTPSTPMLVTSAGANFRELRAITCKRTTSMKEIPTLHTSAWMPYCSPDILSGCWETKKGTNENLFTCYKHGLCHQLSQLILITHRHVCVCSHVRFGNGINQLETRKTRKWWCRITTQTVMTAQKPQPV